MQIWKSVYMFVFPESLGFLILQILERYFPVKFVSFLKSRLIFI